MQIYEIKQYTLLIKVMTMGKIVPMKQGFVSMTNKGRFLLLFLGEKDLSFFDEAFSNQYWQDVCRRLPFLLFADCQITI